MRAVQRILAAITALYIASVAGCSHPDEKAENREAAGEPSVSRAEHDREVAATEGEQVEESGLELVLGETFDEVRKGARLILAYDGQSHFFVGSVENTTGRTLKRVRVEVHLSNGKELGPTTPTDLRPGQRIEVRLPAASRDFDRWTTHAEVGEEEHQGREGRGEHDREGHGEPGKRHR